jgi:quercetin dioxygenase-like cupin family protein
MNVLPIAFAAAALAALSQPAAAGDFKTASVSVAGQERVLTTPFGPIVLLATAESTGGAIGMFSTTEPPGAKRPPLAHSGEDEMFHVLAGTYRFVVGGKTIEGGPGTTIVIPRTVINQYENIGKTDGHLLVAELPGGFEQFFVDVAAQKATTRAAIWALEAAHGITDHGPKPE